MSLFGILLILAILTAIPTFGLSFVALFFAKKWINSNEGQKVAAAAINAAHEDKTVTIPFVSPAGVQKFFRTYGTTAKKFDRVGRPTSGYIGYVSIHGFDETVIMANGSGALLHVTSFAPPENLGDDLMSLFAKKQFVDSIIELMHDGTSSSVQEPPKMSELSRFDVNRTEPSVQSEGIQSIVRRANAGDSDAQYKLAQHYRDGTGVRQSDRRAFEWCLRAAEHENDHDPMFDVAEMYRLGHGTRRNLNKAFRWYVAADDWAGDHAEAKNRVGIMYRDGHGASQDYELARDWFFGASTQGHHEAMFNLGMMIASGQGGPVDYHEAMSWILPAADGGYELAKHYANRVKRLNRSESPFPEDPHAAFDWYVQAAGRSHKKIRRQMKL